MFHRIPSLRIMIGCSLAALVLGSGWALIRTGQSAPATDSSAVAPAPTARPNGAADRSGGTPAPASACPLTQLGLSAPELSPGRVSDGLLRQWCRFQGWLLRHPGAWSAALLKGCYTADLLLYVKSPKDFLGRRRQVMGPNFAALGRLIVGDYAQVARLITQPQQRSSLVGPFWIVSERFPANFPLFLSDREVGGDGRHEALHAWIWEHVAQPAEARADSARLQQLITETAATLHPLPRPLTKATVTPPVRQLVVRYMLGVLFELEPTAAQADSLISLFLLESMTRNYLSTAVEPFALPEALLGRLAHETEEMRRWLGTSPLFAEGGAAMAAAPLPRDEMVDVMFAALGVAAMGGTSKQLTNLLTIVPDELAPKLDDPAVRLRVILEAARLDGPVNNVNVSLPAAQIFTVEGVAHEFPAGTVVAASIGTANMDPTPFPDPSRFDPDRPGLVEAALSFNSVGFHPAPRPDSRRVCPGRNVAMRLSDDFLVAWRKAAAR